MPSDGTLRRRSRDSGVGTRDNTQGSALGLWRSGGTFLHR